MTILPQKAKRESSVCSSAHVVQPVRSNVPTVIHSFQSMILEGPVLHHRWQLMVVTNQHHSLQPQRFKGHCYDRFFLLGTSASLLGAKGLTSSNKKLLETIIKIETISY